MEIERKRVKELVPYAVVFPYKKMGRSISGFEVCRAAGKFGPFDNQIFVGDYTLSIVMRATTEKVNGVWQGACYPFREGLGTGLLSLHFMADGSMVTGGTNRGWPVRGMKDNLLQRLNWTGRTFQQGGTTLTLTLTGLNPLGTYDMAFYWSDGDNANMRMIISDADAATNASTLARVTVTTTGGLTGDTSTYQQGAAGANANGVVQWTGISPGSDGDLVVSMDRPSSTSSVHAGIYSAFRLEETAVVPEPSTCAIALAGLVCGGYSLFHRRKRA
jgi:hypothetical protein